MGADELIEELRAELAAVRAEAAARIEELERRCDDDERRIASLEASRKDDRGTASTVAADLFVDAAHPTDHKPELDADGGRWTRRALLLGGAGAAAGAVAGVAGAAPAAAGTGAMQYGADNAAGFSRTTLQANVANETLYLLNSGSGLAMYAVSFGSSAALAARSEGGHGIVGFTEDWFGVSGRAEGSGSGVVGEATSGFGASGRSNTGPGVHASSISGAALWLDNRAIAAGPPVGGPYVVGQLVAPADGSVWVCVRGGNPGHWRLLASPQSAGAFVPITPTRVYDSRSAQPSAGARLVPGSPRNISVADGRDLATGAVTVPNLVPTNTMAVALNLTVTGAPGSGWVALTPGGAANFTSSAINFQANQSSANGLVTTLNPATRAVKAWASTSEVHVIIDITGYFRAT